MAIGSPASLEPAFPTSKKQDLSVGCQLLYQASRAVAMDCAADNIAMRHAACRAVADPARGKPRRNNVVKITLPHATVTSIRRLMVDKLGISISSLPPSLRRVLLTKDTVRFEQSDDRVQIVRELVGGCRRENLKA